MLDFAVEAGTVLRDERKKSQRRMRRAVGVLRLSRFAA